MKVLTSWLLSRARRKPCNTVVLHATDGASAASSIDWLRQIWLSYHYLIERDGTITKCVPYTRVAYHAGKSVGPEGKNVNDYSVGIAFANFQSKGELLTERQIDAAYFLTRELKLAVPTLQYVTTHYAISPGRKTDPSMLPKRHLAQIARNNNLRVWGVEL